jgi:acetyl esterase/lipase
VAHNASSLNANPKAGFVIGGASAGGNLSAVLAQLARDEKLDPPLTGQYLCVPAISPPSSVPEEYKPEYLSAKENVSDPVLHQRDGDSESIYDSLIPVLKMDIASPLFTPLANKNGVKNLPPAYFQICRYSSQYCHRQNRAKLMGRRYGPNPRRRFNIRTNVEKKRSPDKT